MSSPICLGLDGHEVCTAVNGFLALRPGPAFHARGSRARHRHARLDGYDSRDAYRAVVGPAPWYSWHSRAGVRRLTAPLARGRLRFTLGQAAGRGSIAHYIERLFEPVQIASEARDFRIEQASIKPLNVLILIVAVLAIAFAIVIGIRSGHR